MRGDIHCCCCYCCCCCCCFAPWTFLRSYIASAAGVLVVFCCCSPDLRTFPTKVHFVLKRKARRACRLRLGPYCTARCNWSATSCATCSSRNMTRNCSLTQSVYEKRVTVKPGRKLRNTFTIQQDMYAYVREKKNRADQPTSSANERWVCAHRLSRSRARSWQVSCTQLGVVYAKIRKASYVNV